jgi:hypothetical protein
MLISSIGISFSAVPGLPFTEDFADKALLDSNLSNADWDTNTQSISLAKRQARGDGFSPGVDLSSGFLPDTILRTGDINADGYPDLVAVSRGGTSFYIHDKSTSGNPYLSFYTHPNIHSYDGALGDLDHDGYLDYVAGGDYLVEQIAVHMNNHSLTQPFVDDAMVIDNYATRVRLADVNGDGYLDLVAYMQLIDTTWGIQVYINNTSSTPFGGVTPQLVGLAGGTTFDVEDIVLVDVDGDMDLDIATARRNLTNRLYLNNGSSDTPFASINAIDITADTDNSSSIKAGDLDGDGDIDLAIGNIYQSNKIYLNDGNSDLDGNPFSSSTGIELGVEADFTSDITITDIDKDGDLDIFTANNHDESNYLYRNTGSSNPFDGVVAEKISQDQLDTTSMVLIDVDNDNDLDVLVGNNAFPVRLYSNETSLNPFVKVSSVDLGIELDESEAAAVGDLNGDGLDDVIVTRITIARIYFNGGGDSPFDGVSATNLGGITWPDDVAIVDLNGDTHLDLVFTSVQDTGKNQIFYNNGTSNPFDGVSRVDIATEQDLTKSVDFGDVDNDGDIDLIFGNFRTPDYLYLNDGSIGGDPFSTATAIVLPYTNIGSGAVQLVDLNADGFDDLIVAVEDNYQSAYYLNNGTSQPFGDSPLSFAESSVYSSSITTGDVDNDGDIDIVFGNGTFFNSGIEYLYLNNGTSTPFNGVTPFEIGSQARYTTDVNLVDFDRDGDLDLFVANNGQTDQLFINDGESVNPFSVPAIDISADTLNSVHHLLSDFDNDGDFDLVVATNKQPTRLYYNSTARNSFTALSYSTVGSSSLDSSLVSTDVAVADINRDGKPDLLTANVGSVNRFHLNDGVEAPFDSVVGSDLGSDEFTTFDIEVADINNDGWLDVVAANFGASNQLYLNNKLGSFSSASNISNDAAGPSYSLSVADVNGDGWLDVVTAEYDGINRLYLNDKVDDPFDTVSGQTIGSADAENSYKIITADINADGYIDVVVANYAEPNRLYLGTSSANPYAAITNGLVIGTDNDNTFSVAYGDVDGDGDIDVVAGNSGINKLYLNDGDNSPFDALTTGDNITDDVDNTRDILLVDIDVDGDLDVIAVNDDNTNRLYRNNGTATPFNNSVGIDLGKDASSSLGMVVADFDGDGGLDIAEAISGAKNRIFQAQPFDIAKGQITSLEVDTTTNIATASLLTSEDSIVNTESHWYLSNDGGNRWLRSYPGETTVFPELGDDLRWRVEMSSLTTTRSPRATQVDIDVVRDQDRDGVLDSIDICPAVADAGQLDSDGDAVAGGTANVAAGGNACDNDDDNDGTIDTSDLFPFNPLEQLDFDGDCSGDFTSSTAGNGCGDNSDPDIDGDGILNASDTTNPFNVKPQISGVASTSVLPGSAYSFVPDSIDPGYDDVTDGGVLSFSITNKPVWADFNTVTGELSGYPSNDNYGSTSNIIISVSDSIESAVLAGFDLLVTDTRLPITTAIPPAGNYRVEQDIYLNCADAIGSGCSSTYYSITASDAAEAGSYLLYSTPINISSDSKLWFYSEDASGNTEIEQSSVYFVDTFAPVVSVTSPSDNVLLNNLANIVGHSSDADTGVTTVELKISGGNKAVQSQDGQLLPGTPEWVTVDTSDNFANWTYISPVWSHDTIYTIVARATDGAGNSATTTHSFHYYNADPAYSTLDLNLSSSSVIYGGQVDASFKLTELGDPDADLADSDVYLVVTDPEYDEQATLNPGKQYTIGPFSTNTDGQVTVTGLGEEGNGLLPDGDDADSSPDDMLFDKKGTWTLQAQYAGNLALAAANSQPQILLVGTSAGYAVIVEGKADNNEGLESHHKTGKRIYQTLLERGFAEQNIFYFSYYYNDPDLALSDANDDGTPDRLQLGVGMDSLPSKAEIQSVLQDQLAPLVAFNPAPIYLVMVDHGASDHRFLLGSEDISPTDLNNWLTDLESDLNILEPDALNEPRAVILGYCYSGGFVDELSAANRLIISSAAANEESYKGPLESDGVRVGEYFLEELFQELGKGNTFKQAFIEATDKTETYTRSGGASANSENAYLDDAEQHPLLDDNGNGQGSNVLDSGSEDGQLADLLVLGTGPNYDTNSLENPAEVSAVTETGFLSNAQSNSDLWLKANDNGQVSQAYVEIREPLTTLSSTGTGTEQLSADFTKRILLVPGQNDGSGVNPYDDRFYIDADGLTEPGKYEIFYYVEDVETGNISPARRSVVYKDLASNNAPTYQDDDISSSWDLLTPADSSSTKTAVIFDWEDAKDPDGHAFTYTLEIADSSDFDSNPTFNGQAGVYRLEELLSSQAVVDATAGLQDQATYYWRVKAIDIYGKRTVSTQTWSFMTNNNNAPPGIIIGIIYSDQDFSRLASANLSAMIGEFNGVAFSAENGEYIMLLPPGLAQLTTTKAGFASKVFNDIQVPVSTLGTPSLELNIQLIQAVDADDDGVVDDEDDFPNNDAASTDTDNDGQPDAWNAGCDTTCQSSSGLTLDLDDDNDGMSDEYETANGLNPLIDDAAGDLDNDGHTNLEEFIAGTAANDPGDPRKSSVIFKILPLILNAE